MARWVCFAAIVGVVAAGALSGSAASSPAGVPAFFTVRSDARLCPSPRCGGYWVALVNGVRTTCADGVRRAQCYVAEARGASLFDGGLARGVIRVADYGGLGRLGVLVASAAFAPAGSAAVSGGYYRVRDTGIRCVRAPCFSYRATQVNGSTRTTMTDVDLVSAWATPGETERAQEALHTTNGLLARGRFLRSHGEVTFRALRMFLRAPQPRA